MQNAIFGILLLVVVNTVPSKVKNFELFFAQDKNKSIEFSWNSNAERWDVEDKNESKGNNWLEVHDGYLVAGSNDMVDTIDYSSVLPNYKNINWKKTKMLEVESSKISINKKRKKAILTLEDNFSSNSMEILVEW